MSGKSIAEAVLGVTDPTDYTQSMIQAHETLTGEALGADDLRTEMARADWASQDYMTSSTNDEQRALAFRTLNGLFQEQQLRYASTFVGWPVYDQMMQRYGSKADGSATALMIGAMSSVSARSFEVLAQDLYGATLTPIVDISAGKDVRRHGQFVYGSGLQLPFRSGSIDFVHTSQLLHMLHDPTDWHRPYKAKALSLFAEIGRVLAPGGQVFMQELSPGIAAARTRADRDVELEKCNDFIVQTLHKFGVEEVFTEPVIAPFEVEYLFDPNRDFTACKEYRSLGSIAVYGRKPTRQPIALAARVESRRSH